MRDQSFSGFGLRVTKLIEERGVDKKAFAEAVGIDRQMIYDWLNKDNFPIATTAYKIAKYFNVTVEYLVTGTEEANLKSSVDELKGRLKAIKDFVKNA